VAGRDSIGPACSSGAWHVVVWGGIDRLAYHGVMPLKEAPEALFQPALHPLLETKRINLTFRKAAQVSVANRPQESECSRAQVDPSCIHAQRRTQDDDARR
jgi:hypothetical protein